MDKAQALHSFWSSFGVTAMDEVSAYDTDTISELAISFPYITYEVATGSFGDLVAIGGDIWDQSTSWAAVSQKADEIEAYIGLGGRLIPYDGGAMWITRGNPFAQRMSAESGYDVRRIHININAEFISA